MKTHCGKSSAMAPGAPQRKNINKSVFDIRCSKNTATTVYFSVSTWMSKCARWQLMAQLLVIIAGVGAPTVTDGFFPSCCQSDRDAVCVQPAPPSHGCLFFLFYSSWQRGIFLVTGAFLLLRKPDSLFLELDDPWKGFGAFAPNISWCRLLRVLMFAVILI